MSARSRSAAADPRGFVDEITPELAKALEMLHVAAEELRAALEEEILEGGSGDDDDPAE